ncbi:hypothetical protein C8Q76DRAFT_758909 [Earliella scabrosa]|nr:hypothetical protein C8Q76DRAFT_758909 [Earliella scabrosa]
MYVNVSPLVYLKSYSQGLEWACFVPCTRSTIPGHVLCSRMCGHAICRVDKSLKPHSHE